MSGGATPDGSGQALLLSLRRMNAIRQLDVEGRKVTAEAGVVLQTLHDAVRAQGLRIRDKFAASRAKGIWMGGFVPMGYDVVDRKLVINEAEADMVRHIFQRFVELGSATLLTRELVASGTLNKRGKPIDKGFLYKLFRNRV